MLLQSHCSDEEDGRFGLSSCCTLQLVNNETDVLQKGYDLSKQNIDVTIFSTLNGSRLIKDFIHSILID